MDSEKRPDYKADLPGPIRDILPAGRLVSASKTKTNVALDQSAHGGGGRGEEPGEAVVV